MPLKDKKLAYQRPINVFIGGLANISPAEVVSFIFILHFSLIMYLSIQNFNVETFETEVTKTDTWSQEATENFIKHTGEDRNIIFIVSAIRGGHNFGQMLLQSDDESSTYNIENLLCYSNEAIRCAGNVKY